VKLLLDDMYAPGVAVELTGQGFDVVAVAGPPHLRGMADEELLAYATTERRALVTENMADFKPLATQWAGRPKTHAGLILTNPKRFNRATLAYPGNLIAALREFLADPPITGESWIWWL
jgi:predicted nuclease of predicted toxin-antitoxin system